MVVVTLKNGGNREIFGNIFKINGSKYEIMMKKAIKAVLKIAYSEFVEYFANRCLIKVIAEGLWDFINFLCARYDTDVTLQKYYCSSGSVKEGKKYFLGSTNSTV